MLKVSLEEELNSIKKKEVSIEDSITKDVKLLLEANALEDMRIANGLGRQHQLAVAQTSFGEKIELEKLELQYGNKIFTRDQIKALALDYNLRFLSTTKYRGNLAVEAILKIKEFAKESKIDLNDWSLQNHFYILAPEEMFDLNTKSFPPKDDPLLFYKIDDNRYRLIHKWGSDFSVLRLLNGFVWRNSTNRFITDLFMLLPILALIISLIVPKIWLLSEIYYPLAICVLTFIITLIRFHVKYTDSNDSTVHGLFSEGKWDSQIFYKKK